MWTYHNASYPDNPSVDYVINNADFMIISEYDYYTGDYVGDEIKSTDAHLSADKANQLADFMASWGEAMEQGYTAYYPGGDGTMFGLAFPSEVISSLAVYGSPASAYWSEDGIEFGDYAVVAAYADYESVVNYERRPNFYLFAIVNDQAIVLHSQQNQAELDGLTHFSPTQNAELQAAFESIVWN